MLQSLTQFLKKKISDSVDKPNVKKKKRKKKQQQHGCSWDLHQQEASQDLTGITIATTPTGTTTTIQTPEYICKQGQQMLLARECSYQNISS